MPSDFSVDAEPARDLVRIRIGGFFQSDDLRRLTEAWRAALARLHCPSDKHLALVDTRAALICSQEMVGHWSALATDPAFRSRRLAFIIAPTLVRKQVQRATADVTAQSFIDETEAEAWLFSEEAKPALVDSTST